MGTGSRLFRWAFEMRKSLLFAAIFLSACHDRRPPAPSPRQSDQLNQAESLLNGMARNEEGPTDRSAGPSNNKSD
jgi:hypothetical protein